MKVSDFVANYLASLSPQGKTRVYAVCGAGAMHLNDSICHHDGIEVIPMQHEQAATYAAEAESRVTNNISVVHVTAGPGGSNTLTGVACAYVDSIPILIIAGQVTKSTMLGHSGLRQSGMNELDMVGLMQPITKMAITVPEPFMVRYYLEKAVHTAMTGRRGPVFIEIPLDIQAAEIDPEKMGGFCPIDVPRVMQTETGKVLDLLAASQRPVIIVGNGVRLAGAVEEFRGFARRLGIPVVSSWTATDIAAGLPSHIGKCGIFGDRQSNYAVQNADLILAIGTRLSVAQTGHHAHLFAPKAKKIVVDIDPEECLKDSIRADVGIIADARDFLRSIDGDRCDSLRRSRPWNEWLESIPLLMEPGFRHHDGIAAYEFIDALTDKLDDDAIVVTDVGFSFIPAMQRLRVKYGQRLFHSCGVSPMGWAIPAAIGAAKAAPGRQVVCLTGDGGTMMNIQELHTIAQQKLPIAIFVFANNGYATMRIPQMNHFGRESISGPDSGNGIDWVMLAQVAQEFGIFANFLHENMPFRENLSVALYQAKKVPSLFSVKMAPDQVIAPRVQAALGDDGKFKPATLEDMWPPLAEQSWQKLEAVFGT